MQAEGYLEEQADKKGAGRWVDGRGLQAAGRGG